MFELVRTSSDHPDFILLVSHLDAYLKTVDGEEHAFYDQFNGLENLKHVLVAYWNGKAVGCGAMKEYAKDTIEIKRMYTAPESRGNGFAKALLQALEIWALELHYEKCILETGQRQTEAIALYTNSEYIRIPNYEPYNGIANSVCFLKRLITIG